MNSAVEIRRAAPDEQPVIGNLLQLYMYEFSAELGTDVRPDGRFEWDGLADYWNDPGLHPFLVRVNGTIAGFALVQRHSVVTGRNDVWDMEDFCILAKYRRHAVGREVMSRLFRQFTGPWEIRVLQGNTRAMAFWRSVIHQCCGHEVMPESVVIDGRTFQVFRFAPA